VLQAAAVLAGGACMQQVQQIGSLASLSKLHASAAAALAGEAQVRPRGRAQRNAFACAGGRAGSLVA
jgi:hypothetical protein